MTFFKNVPSFSKDPILELIRVHSLDQRPNKIDLGVGVYKDEVGNTPIFSAIKKAAELVLEKEKTKSYLPLSGLDGFSNLVADLVFRDKAATRDEQRLFGVHTAGGTSALRLAMELIKISNPNATIWISDPTWPNHKPLVAACGLFSKSYHYYDKKTGRINEDEFFSLLGKLGKNDVLLVHGCCHNPSGADLTSSEWDTLARLAQKNGFLVLIDTAYHGLGDGLNQDIYGVRKLAQTLPELIVTYSCSKNFGIYRERTGVIFVLGSTKSDADRAKSSILHASRGMSSMPPSYGAMLVKSVLENDELKEEWVVEVSKMRKRIAQIRQKLAKKLGVDFDFISHQKGLFSTIDIPKEKVLTLRDKFGIYMVGSGRINITGLNDSNMDRFASALLEVL